MSDLQTRNGVAPGGSALRVAVAGAAGPLGRRVCEQLMSHPEVSAVVGFDVQSDPGISGLDFVGGDLASMNPEPQLAGVDAVVHLVSALAPWPSDAAASSGDVEATRRLLSAAAAVGATKLVVLSTAMVYGAWPNNQVPITEAAPLRPVPEMRYAVHKAELERYVSEWATEHDTAEVVTLRPTVSLAEDHVGWVAKSLRAAANLTGDNEVPVQFLHLDDLATAVVLGVTGDLSGVYNVAPEGWMTSDTTLDLIGRTPRLQVSETVADRLAAWWWKYRLAPTGPGTLPYTVHPWVVASDRLRAAGWRPRYTNEQAFVAGYRGRPWAMLDPRRRQQLAIGAAATGAAAVLGGGVALAARLRRRGASGVVAGD